jgi:hypothetical protein
LGRDPAVRYCGSWQPLVQHVREAPPIKARHGSVNLRPMSDSHQGLKKAIRNRWFTDRRYALYRRQ